MPCALLFWILTDVVFAELTKRGICLGRTPGFKQADIDDAFWDSVKNILLGA